MTSKAQPARILVADDREDILKALHALLKSRGYHSCSARSPQDVLARLTEKCFDAVLLDLNYSRDITSGEEGLDLLARIQSQDPNLPVIVLTAWASVDLAVAAMRRGARDFVEKPWDNQRLLNILENQLALGRALSNERRLKAANRLLDDDGGLVMIAQSSAMKPVVTLIERIGPTDANVLITGEHGTGKGVVARMLHRHSERAGQPLITVNIGAIASNLFESELFGHVKGAFTDARRAREGRFQLAHLGTLFLDEIGNLSLPLQAKMLRVIETGEYEAVGSSRTEHADVRLLSATNANLSERAGRGAFREDLLFRLNTIEIRVPPLRDRREDILPLADHFLVQHGSRHRRPGLALSQQAGEALLTHAWPGNVRELDHVVQRGVLMAQGKIIQAEDLGLASTGALAVGLNEEMSIEEMEQLMIGKALHRTGGNIKAAAAQLGLGRSSLYRRLEKYGMVNHEGKE